MTLTKSPAELTILQVVNAVEPIQRIKTCPVELAWILIHKYRFVWIKIHTTSLVPVARIYRAILKSQTILA